MPVPAPEDAVQEAERALGRPFPRSLRARYLKENGGDVEVEDEDWVLHPVWDGTDRRTVRSSASHVVHETDEARQWPGFPEDGVSIASDGSGNHIALLPNSNEFWLWDHETAELRAVTLEFA